MKVLKGWSYVEVFPNILHATNAFGERAEFNMDTSHVFPHGVLATITLAGNEARDGGVRAGIGCKAGLPLCSVTITALSGARSDTKLLEQKPWGSGLSWLYSLWVCVFPFLAAGTLSQSGVGLKQEVPMWGPCGLLAGFSHRQRSDELPVHTPMAPLRCSFSCIPFVPHSWSLPPASTTPALLWNHYTEQAGPTWPLTISWGVSCDTAAAFRDLGCFWGTTWVSANNSCRPLTQAPHQDQVISASHGQAFSLVVAAPFPVPTCDMEWPGPKHVLGLGWGSWWGNCRKSGSY